MGTRGPDPDVPDEKLLEAMQNTPFPAVSTKDVSERVGLSTERVRERLNRLADEGVIGRRKIGNSVIYWLFDG